MAYRENVSVPKGTKGAGQVLTMMMKMMLRMTMLVWEEEDENFIKIATGLTRVVKRQNQEHSHLMSGEASFCEGS